jgi:hypothetical protein
MTLLDEVIEAHGGADRWAQLERFTVHASMDGALFTHKGVPGTMKDMVLTGSTRDQQLSITGFTAPEKRCIYRSDHVAIESLDGVTLQTRDDPRSAFDGHAHQTQWDELHLACFCGYTHWNYLMAPFLFARPGFQTEELGPWQQDGETWRRLKVVFPSDIVTHCPEQTFYYDDKGLQRRMDYQSIDAGGTHIVHFSWAHQSFSGIVLPTLRRELMIGNNGIVIAHPAAVNIEVFDALFE